MADRPGVDWSALGARLYLELGRIGRETELHGEEAYGQALRAAVAGRLISVQEHEAAIDQAGARARFELRLARQERAEMRRRNAGFERDLRSELAAELRRRAEGLSGSRRRGLLEAADFLWPRVSRVETADAT